MTNMMIQLKGINKTYFNGAPLHVLKGIDLEIEKVRWFPLWEPPVRGNRRC